MRRSFVIVMLAALLTPGAAFSQVKGADKQPVAGNEDPQRYTMSETADGFLRLDRETGVVSLCKGGEGHWSCVPVPDAQVELDRQLRALEQDNKRLATRANELEARLREIARSAETELPDDDDTKPESGKTVKPRGPDDLTQREKRQIDRFLDFSEHAMRRFFGVMKTLREEYEKGI